MIEETHQETPRTGEEGSDTEEPTAQETRQRATDQSSTERAGDARADEAPPGDAEATTPPVEAGRPAELEDGSQPDEAGEELARAEGPPQAERPAPAASTVETGSDVAATGDTMTPTKINFFLFWLFEIPAAYLLALHLGWKQSGVFWSIVFAESLAGLVGIWLFRRGKWNPRGGAPGSCSDRSSPWRPISRWSRRFDGG